MSEDWQTTSSGASCCSDEPAAPTVENPPDQPQLRYRIGTHATLLDQMMRRISQVEIPSGENAGTRPLAALTSRSADDPAIALMDAFASACDVLTFYQERIANEGFMRTATERRSVRALARSIGCELRPGVAASTWLAFGVSPQRGESEPIPILPGASARSVPLNEDERPNTYETIEAIVAKRRFDNMAPRLRWPSRIGDDPTGLSLLGVGHKLSAGQQILVVTRDGLKVPKVLQTVEEDKAAGETHLTFTVGSDEPAAYVEDPPPAGEIGTTPIPLDDAAAEEHVLGRTWTEGQLRLFLEVNRWDEAALLTLVDQAQAAEPTTDGGTTYRFRDYAGVFGHNAPRWRTLPVSQRYGEFVPELDSSGQPIDESEEWVPGAYPNNWDWEVLPPVQTPTTVWTDSQGVDYSDGAYDLYLSKEVGDLALGSYLLLSGKISATTFAAQLFTVTAAETASLVDYAISARVTGVKLDRADTFTSNQPFWTRRTIVYLSGEEAVVAQFLETEPIAAGATTVELGRLVPGLDLGKAVALSGERADAPGVSHSEVRVLTGITHVGGRTHLTFERGLEVSYRRDSLRIQGNLVLATHGERIQREVLGSGDGRQKNQRFKLSQSPVTHVPAAVASGALTTLSVRVDGVEWSPRRDLYAVGPTDRVYTVQRDDEDATWVIFGDGIRGARLPTGKENVTASYRVGLGEAGAAAAGQITQLKERPLGIKEVTNPVPARGGADAESRDDARARAPLGILTLERVVSLRDVEDFAHQFAGLGQARATPILGPGAPFVYLTVAGLAGAPVKTTDALYLALRQGLDAVREPELTVRIGSHRAVYFNVAARIRVDAAYEADAILEATRAHLRRRFSFDNRSLAAALSSADVLATIHEVPGVIAADLDALYFAASSFGAALLTRLNAEDAHVEGADVVPAQLLMINDAGIELSLLEVQ